MVSVTRRKLLCALSLSVGAGGLSVSARERLLEEGSNSDATPERTAFDPAVDAFGFDNYSTPPVAPKPAEFVTERDLRDHLATALDGVLRGRLTQPVESGFGSPIDSIAEGLYANANRLFGTRGYCYGMAAAAQWYFEDPGARPVDRESTSEITHVNAPLEEPSSRPVRTDIEAFHRSQFTNVGSWFRRRTLLRPAWIDYRSQAGELRAAIDERGSAGVTITGENVLAGHYVLLYDYAVDGDRVTFAVYDPNDAADEYAAGESRSLGIDTANDRPLLESYAGKYDRFLFTPGDREIRARVRSDRR